MDISNLTSPAQLDANSGGRVIRQGSYLTPDDVADLTAAMAAVYRPDTSSSGICVADGHGLRVTIHRGHLEVSDGLGSYRRVRRFAKATHGLSHLVILGHSGMLTLDSLRWCDRLEIPLLVLDTSQTRPVFASVPKGLDDARLRRAQALAAGSDLGLGIVCELLGAKVAGQAEILRDRLQLAEAAATVEALAEALEAAESIEECRQLEASAAARYWQAWVGHPAAAVRFAKKDLARIPEHWRRYDGRRSVLMSVNGNRRAERPVNAVLNYLFALAELEATLACRIVGLDPGLGLVHLDAKGRQSLALDLIEPVRPTIEAWVLDLLERRSFLRRGFTEAADGHVRLLAPLTHELAETLPRWRQAVAPWAERVAHLLGQAIEGKWQATARLTGAHRKQAQDRVRARKAANRAVLAHALASPRPRQRPAAQPELPLIVTCRECGAPIPGRFRRYCPTCGVLLPGQDPTSRARRGRGIAASRAELERWRAEHPGAAADPEAFRETILPGLAGVKLSEIMAALGCAKSTASLIRSGRHVPALRHWPALGELAGVPLPGAL